jgi:hypothetical protein
MRKIIFILALILVGAGMVGCAREPLKELDTAYSLLVGYGSVDAQFCTKAPTPAQQNLKYLFVLDHSASNQPGFPNPLTPNDLSSTDPQGSRRYGPMVNFIQTMAPVPMITPYFGLIDFNDSALEPQGLSGFESDVPKFLAAVTKDWIGGGTAQFPSPNDAGFTNYQDALQLALQIIKQDAQAAAGVGGITNAYVIVFVSDGAPTVPTPGALNPTYTQDFTTDIEPVIQQLLNLKNDPAVGDYISNITLNTAYYFDNAPVPAADTLLQAMANAGNGQYIRFAAGQNVLYQQFAPPARNIRNLLVDVFVENESAIWSDDGRLMLDSDTDGLSDLIESQQKSRSNVKDTDGNGVSDFVEYSTKGYACDGIACSPIGRDPYALCAGFSPITVNGRVTFSSSTNDGFNDCEKFLLGANRTVFNTNGNLIPDTFAFKSGLPIIPGTANSAFLDPFRDGITNYEKLKSGLPVQVSKATLFNYKTRVTSLVPTSSPSPQVDCYHLSVSQIALTGLNNRIRIDLVQNGSVLSNKPFLQSAAKSFDGTSATISFGSGDFK